MAATRKAPIFTLIVLAPAVAELLFGSVRISTIFVLIPQFMTWDAAP